MAVCLCLRYMLAPRFPKHAQCRFENEQYPTPRAKDNPLNGGMCKSLGRYPKREHSDGIRRHSRRDFHSIEQKALLNAPHHCRQGALAPLHTLFLTNTCTAFVAYPASAEGRAASRRTFSTIGRAILKHGSANDFCVQLRLTNIVLASYNKGM